MIDFLLLLMFQDRRRNPARKNGGYGAWIVVDVEIATPERDPIGRERGFLALRSHRAYNRGGVVNPKEIALTRLCLERIKREEQNAAHRNHN